MSLTVNLGFEPLAHELKAAHAALRNVGEQWLFGLVGPRYLAAETVKAIAFGISAMNPDEANFREAVSLLTSLVSLIAEVPEEIALQMALDQAQSGKGAKQHGKNFADGDEAVKPFAEQVVFRIEKIVGAGFCTGQAIKKTVEAMVKFDRGEKEACVNELLGAMVYLAAANLATDTANAKRQTL